MGARDRNKIVDDALVVIEEARRLKMWWDKLTPEQREDRFYIEMADIYWSSTPIVEHILRVCAAFGARFASVGSSDIVVFEDIRHDRWPVSWHIVKLLGISFGCGNSGQHQIDLHKHLRFSAQDELALGTYDLREVPFVKVAPPLAYGTMSFYAADQKFKDGDLLPYIEKARTLERLREPACA